MEANNLDIKRYYLYTFIKGLTKIRGGFMTMSYFYFMGFSIESIMTIIVIYGLSALLMIKPIIMLMNKIGVKYTFLLHILTSIISFFIVINISLENQFLFYIWMVVHGFTIMSSRIPLTAYFTKVLNENKSGKQLSFLDILENISSIIVPIIFGALIDKTGIIIYAFISTFIGIIAALVLWGKENPKVQLNSNILDYVKMFPKKIGKGIFISRLPYILTEDTLGIFIIILLGNFTVAGVLISIKTIFEMILSYLVGHYCDKGKVRIMFYIVVILSSVFRFLVPFIQNPLEAFLLQISFGMINLVLETPVNYEYHKYAKSSNKEIELSIGREIFIQSGMVIGGIIIIFLAFLLGKNWYYLFPLGILLPIGYSLIIPKKN